MKTDDLLTKTGAAGAKAGAPLNPRKKRVKTAPVSGFGDPRRVRRLKQVEEHYPSRAGLFRKVYQGKASPRQCIKAFCLECNGWEMFAIRDCSATACPIWGLRPYQGPEKEEA